MEPLVMNPIPDGAGGAVGGVAAPQPAVMAEISQVFHRVLLGQDRLFNNLTNHVQRQDTANNTLFRLLQVTQRDQGIQIDQNTTQINEVSSRVDEMEGDVSEIKKYLTKLLEAAADPEPRRSNGLNQASDEVVMVPPDAVAEEDNPPPPEVPEPRRPNGFNQAPGEVALVLPSPGVDGFVSKENSVLFRKRVVIKGAFGNVERGIDAVKCMVQNFGGRLFLRFLTEHKSQYIHIYDTVDADESATNAFARARDLGIPCFTIGELVNELIDDVQVQEGQHHQVHIDIDENVDDVDEDDQEDRQRLQDRGYCTRCIEPYMEMEQENAQPNWCVKGCPMCDRY